MGTRKMKAVVVGAGWAGEGHTRALQHYGVDVVAICARKPDVVQGVASRLGIPEASIDWRKSIMDAKPDIVALTTPAILRAEVIEMAAELGCHLLCEKPLATSAEEAERLYTIIKQTGVKHAFAATHLYDPSVAWVKQLLSDQAIGELKEVDVAFSRWAGKGRTDKVKPWNWMSSLAHGGGALNNGLTHQLGMLERMTGRKMISAVGEAKIVKRKAPVLPEIHDFRLWIRKEITAEEASDLEWRDCDAEWGYSAFLKLGPSSPFGSARQDTADLSEETSVSEGKGNTEGKGENILVTMRPTPGVPSNTPTGAWYFYGDKGTLVGKGGHILSPITKHVGSEVEELPVPQELSDKLPRIGDDIQNKWVALVRDFVADIEGRPHDPYLTLRDGWRYQIAIEAIRESKGWAQIPE
jgi:predicted dehydrogenase